MSKSVLIVDDSAIVREVMHQFFDSLEDWVVGGESANGADAIQKAMKLKPELIILDVSMPRLNGIEAASILKRVVPDSYIVLLTMFDDAFSSRLPTAVGVDMIISKAEGLSGLVKAIQHLTGTTGLIKDNLKAD